MSKSSTEVDTAPESVGEVDVGTSENTTEISHKELSNLFSRPDKEVVEDVEDMETDGSENVKVEKPATETEPESVLEEEESSLKEDEEKSKPEVKAEKEEDDEEPTWFRKRIDKITAQRKEAEERVAALEAKLAEKESTEEPVGHVEQVLDLKQLDQLEKQAIEAEDQVDDLLETEPKYDDEGNAYWQVGDMKKTRQELIQIRKNARNAYRAIPARKEFLSKKATTDANVDKLPFFSDKDNPYYDMAQKTLASPMYKELAAKIPDAKAAIALMIRGKMAIDSEASKAKDKAEVKKPVDTTIKSTPTSKAATDIGTTRPAATKEDNTRKEKKKILASGNVAKRDLVNLFS